MKGVREKEQEARNGNINTGLGVKLRLSEQQKIQVFFFLPTPNVNVLTYVTTLPRPRPWPPPSPLLLLLMEAVTKREQRLCQPYVLDALGGRGLGRVVPAAYRIGKCVMSIIRCLRHFLLNVGREGGRYRPSLRQGGPVSCYLLVLMEGIGC